jgi:hypothetical protein
MDKVQFGVLYRQFLFRMVDLEVLSADGDVKRLLGQFATLLISISSFAGFAGCLLDPRHMPHDRFVAATWGGAHFFIATTMLIVGLFAILSWDSSFPDRPDVLVLGPLPVRPRTMFVAKVTALAVALSLTVGAFNGGLSLTWATFDFSPAGSGFTGALRCFAAFWLASLAGGGFVFCALLGVQGIAGQLPRRYFLRLSSFLQMASFIVLFCGYFLEPSAAVPRVLAAAQQRGLLDWWPSYWFLGLFEKLNGWPAAVGYYPTQGFATLNGAPAAAVTALAERAVAGLAMVVFIAGAAFLLAYLRTLRKIVEEPDILPGARGGAWLPRFGDAFQTAVVRFSIRSLIRSRQHRVILAFYLGIGFAIVTLYLRSGVMKVPQIADMVLMANSILLLCFWVVGTRVVIAMPVDLRANWVFRVTAIQGPAESLEASRRALAVLAAAPVLLGAAAVSFSIWPWRLAAAHLTVLGVLALILVDLCLYGFRKIPFTCSYLPGKSHFHMAFLGGMGLFLLTSWFAEYEQKSIARSMTYVGFLALLVLVAAVVRRLAAASVQDEDAGVQFEDAMTPAVLTLGLNRDGVVPIVAVSVGPAPPR